jgi:hypothetical protein
MKEFFCGWRRKAGTVTLVMALAVAGIWMRSRVVCDTLQFKFGGRLHDIVSYSNQTSGVSWKFDLAFPEVLDWGSIPLNEVDADDIEGTLANYREGYRDLGFFEWHVPHWLLVLPLSLLSAYLILWKPRKQSSPNQLISPNT